MSSFAERFEFTEKQMYVIGLIMQKYECEIVKESSFSVLLKVADHCYIRFICTGQIIEFCRTGFASEIPGLIQDFDRNIPLKNE
jgi:hypothetical protein